MKPSLEQIEAALRAAVKETEQLHQQNRLLREAADEPIAIVGMSCRFPGGVGSPAQLWDLVAEGRDAISSFPADRGWDLERIYDPDPERAATSNTREGGFLVGAGEFDPGFFGISPREAKGMDPQLRLMLEAAWEGLEHAGIDPSVLRGSPTGVFAGVMYHDYGWGLPPTAEAGRALTTGGSSSIVSGHVAYTLGLEGPTLSLDTACSSSLVAMHLACQTLRRGECSLALAGGATVLATPGIFIQFSRQGGVAPDGRCKAFAEAADGAGFSEGAGLLVLERLSDAEANGRRILATIRGSAVNQDGASNGLTAPNGPAQERVIRQALANAGLQPADIDMVEAHGTGTTLGDPIEANALIATYGQERDAPLKLGTLKSNIGHAQAAAGVGGVIKAVMAMRAGVMPKTLHVDRPSSRVDWGAGGVELLTEPLEWRANGHPRRAAVSSFGATGTNAHLVLEESPSGGQAGLGGPIASAAPAAETRPLRGPIPLALTARSEPALREQAGRLAARLREDPRPDPLDLAFSLGTTRARFEQRAVVLGDGPEQLLAGLTALERGEAGDGVLTAAAPSEAKAVFIFSGNGCQWPGMAAELLEASPVFAGSMGDCEEALSPFLDLPLCDVLRGPVKQWPQSVEVVQPIIFAVMVSLGRLWRACGIEPAAVAGHSAGEIAAAVVAGGLSLEDGARIAVVRSRMFGELSGKGGMVSIGLPLDRLESWIAPWQGRIEIAALNGPAAAVLSGERSSLDELLRKCADEGVRARDIPGAVAASHSSYMEVLRERLLEELAPVSPRSAEIPFYSTVEGEAIDTAALDAEYWYRNTRQTVRFEPVVRELLGRGHRVLIEVSPHPVLVPAMADTIDAGAPDRSSAVALGTLRRGEGGAERFGRSLAEAQANGASLDWGALLAGSGAKAVELPTYPFQRKRFWLNAAGGTAGLAEAGLEAADHPLLGAAIADPEGEGMALSGRISLDTHPWLADHAALGTVLLPGTAFVEIALRAAAEVDAPLLDELTLEAPLVLAEDAAALLRVSLAPADERGLREVAIHSRSERAGEKGAWTCHARGLLGSGGLAADGGPRSPERWALNWPPAPAEPIDVGRAYERLTTAGIEYGAAFQGLTAAWRQGDEIYAEVALPGDQLDEARRFGLHPALFDAIGHAGVALALEDRAASADGELPMPFAWKGVRLDAVGAAALRVRMSGEGLTAVDETGAPVLRVESVASRPVDRARLAAAAPGSGSLYRLDWQPLAAESAEPGAKPLVEDLRAPGQGDAGEPSLALASRALELMQGFLAEAGEESLRLAILTEGALVTAEGESPDLAAAPVAGLLRSAASEHPGRFCLIDTDGSEASEAALEEALGADPSEPQLALRDGELLVPRLAPVQSEASEEVRPLDPDRTVLITGATGGIGALVARHLAEARGARHLLLISRSGEDAAGAPRLREELEALGAEVRIAACDASDREQLEELLASLPAEHPLGAVIHCAAVLDDGLIEALDAERLGAVFAPKAEAAWHLHELTRELELSHFVLFSSISGLLGGAAQANYAAANAYLDALAAQRRAQRLPAVSMAWGGWAERSKMTADLDRDQLERTLRRAAERLALLPLSAEHGLALFDAALSGSEALLVPAQLDLALLRSRARSGALPALLKGLVRVPARAGGEGGSLARRLAAAATAEREDLALEVVRGHVAAVLGHDSPAEVAPGKAFKELGFDSLAAVELRNRLAADAGLRLAATAVFDYPNPLALAKHIVATTAGDRPSGQVVRAASAADEPIAIVGMACRFPGGVSSPAELWELVAEGRDAIADLPSDRGWDLERLYDPEPGTPGASYAKQGGFLYDAADFDPAFFGISPREALEMDPQQRLMLEISWEVLEEAGIDPATLRGSATGVFAGSMYQDYGEVAAMTSSAVSGRVAYSLGLEGPAISVDTACSSSLVAMHLAAQALRGGECSLALAGGVAVLSTPAVFVEFSRQRGLAADGRCKAFAEAADGTGIADGAGVLALERLSDAEAKGHRVLATIRGSAINQDGASNGLTAPNGPAQERVIRQALAGAGLAPADVDMVEAHGTGTALGDPIEAGALLATYGQEREAPLRLGSLKSNIGHAQAAAGVGGVIKAVMAMREGTMPRTLHVDRPSSKVEWGAGKVELLTEPVAWAANGQPRRAGVSSFGASGTNAHLILEEAPRPALDGGSAGIEEAEGSESAPLPGWAPLPLSARSQPALREAAAELAAHLRANPQLAVADVARTLATRPRFEQRAIVAERERSGLLDALDALARGEESPAVGTGLARGERKPVFLFGGQGAQWAGMGAELIEASPHFAASMRACEEALAPHVEWSLAEVLREEGGEWLERLDLVQPALFAVMVSLADLWRACGVEPAAVVGHSQGEIAAAYVAGALSLEDAARVIALRSRAMTRIAGEGGMLWLAQPLDQLSPRLERFAGGISLAAVNGPNSLVVSGEPAALAELAASCKQEGIQTRAVAVDYAAHSAQIDALESELLDAFAPISPRPGEIPFHSTVSGDLLDGRELGPRYWFRNLRQTVLFDPVLRSLLAGGSRAFVEIAPHPVLAYGVQETIEDALGSGPDAAVFGALRREDGGASRFTLSLAEAHAHGVGLDWEALLAGSGGEPATLPTYPFQRQRFWPAATAAGSDPRALGQEPLAHPLLGSALRTAAGGLLLTGRIGRRSLSWLDEDPVSGSALLPAAGFVEMALVAAELAACEGVESLQMQEPLVLPAEGEVQLQVSLAAADRSGSRALAIHSRLLAASADEELGERDWVCHATATATHGSAIVLGGRSPWLPPGAESMAVEDLYRRLEQRGVEWNPGWGRIEAAWREGKRFHLELALGEDAATEGNALHPALLHSALAIGALCAPGPAPGEVELLTACESAAVRRIDAGALRVSASPGGDDDFTVDLAGPDGAVFARFEGLRTGGVAPQRLRAGQSEAARLLRLAWSEVSLPALAGEQEDVVLVDFSDSNGGPEEARANAIEALERLQGWIAEKRPAGARLVFLTRGAVAVDAGASPDLATAPLWGMLRSAAAELPGSIALVDLDRSQRSDRALPAALAATVAEPQLAVREGRAMVPRLAPVTSASSDQDPPRFDPQRTILLTGAGGDLGGLAARRLAEAHGARRLLLACGAGEEAAAGRLADDLTALGCEIRIERCDPAERSQLQALLDSISVEHPLGAVIHAARSFDDGVIVSLDAERLTATMRVGAEAAWNLHELTSELDLSRFILFSSAAGTLGTAARAGFGAVAGFLDALAANRRAAGLPATSLAWGWIDIDGEVGAATEPTRTRLGRAGLAPISAQRALAQFDAALALDEPLLAAVELDAAALRALAREGSLPPVLRGLVRTPAGAGGGEAPFAARLAAVAAGERPRLALELVREQIATVLGHQSVADVDPDRPFQELGFDSLAAVELRNRLGSATGLQLPPTLAFDYPTPAALAAHLAEHCVDGGPAANPEQAVDAALAALDRALVSVGENGGARERVGMRVRAALASLAVGDDEQAEVLGEDLAAMSHDEVFALIDEEIGDG